MGLRARDPALVRDVQRLLYRPGVAHERPDAGQAAAAYPRDQARRLRPPLPRYLVAEPATRRRLPPPLLRGGADEPLADAREPTTRRPGRRHARRLPGARGDRGAPARSPRDPDIGTGPPRLPAGGGPRRGDRAG